MWLSRKLYLQRLERKKKLTTYFGESKFAKINKLTYYSQYLKSPEWRKKALDFKIRFPLCEVCRNAKSVHVHHKNYQNVGNEKYWDLLAVCSSCHKIKHNTPAYKT